MRAPPNAFSGARRRGNRRVLAARASGDPSLPGSRVSGPDPRPPPSPTPRVPSRPFVVLTTALVVPNLVIPSAQVVQPAQPLGEARAVHRGGGQENPRRARRVRQQVGGHLPRHPRQVRRRRARPAAHAPKIRHARTPKDSRDSRRPFRRTTLNRRFGGLGTPARDRRAFLRTPHRGASDRVRGKTSGGFLVSLFCGFFFFGGSSRKTTTDAAARSKRRSRSFRASPVDDGFRDALFFLVSRSVTRRRARLTRRNHPLARLKTFAGRITR